MDGTAAGTPDPGDSKVEGSDDERRGRWDERPNTRNKKPAVKEKTAEVPQKYGDATEDKIRISWALGNAIGDTTKRPAQPTSEYEHARYLDIRFWLTTWKDFWDCNPYQWQDEADRIHYVLSKVKG